MRRTRVDKRTQRDVEPRGKGDESRGEIIYLREIVFGIAEIGRGRNPKVDIQGVR